MPNESGNEKLVPKICAQQGCETNKAPPLSDAEVATRREDEDCRERAAETHVSENTAALLNFRGGDAAIRHMVADDRGGGQTGEPLGQIGKWADITENSLDEYGATHGCRGCLANGVTSTEACRARLTERLLNAPEHAEKAKVADGERRGLPNKPGACEIADVGDSDTASDLPVSCQACGVRRSSRTCGGCRLLICTPCRLDWETCLACYWISGQHHDAKFLPGAEAQVNSEMLALDPGDQTCEEAVMQKCTAETYDEAAMQKCTAETYEGAVMQVRTERPLCQAARGNSLQVAHDDLEGSQDACGLC